MPTPDDLIADARRLGDPSPGDGWRRLLWQLADALESERRRADHADGLCAQMIGVLKRWNGIGNGEG